MSSFHSLVTARQDIYLAMDGKGHPSVSLYSVHLIVLKVVTWTVPKMKEMHEMVVKAILADGALKLEASL